MGFAAPSGPYGYYRGSPMAGGQGSGIGMAGNIFSVANSPVQGPGQSGSGWHPTVLYMFVLIIAEMFVFTFISRHL